MKLSSKNLSIRTFELADIKQSLEAVLGAVGYGILLTDLEHRALICNERFGEIFGVDPDLVVQNDVEAVRKMVRRRLPDYRIWEENLSRVYAQPRLEQTDHLVLRDPDCVLLRNTRPVENEQGTTAWRLWTFWDITAEARQQALDKSLAEISALPATEPGEVIQQAATLVGEVFNSTVLVSVLDQGVLKFQSVANYPSHLPVMTQNRLEDSFCQYCLNSGQVIELLDPDTNSLYAQLLPARAGVKRYLGVPIRGLQQEFIGVLCVMDLASSVPFTDAEKQYLTNVAGKIEREYLRGKHLEFLRRDVETLTKDISSIQSQLIQSEKLAIAGALSASVAHDIRNILASIQIQLEIGRSEPELAFSSIEKSLSRFSVLSHRLMSYARPQEQAYEFIDLCEVVKNVQELVQPQFTISGVELVLSLGHSPSFVKGDASRLEHLVVNLLVNALAVSREGEAVEVQVKDSQIIVSDRGPGISAELMAKMFEPFVSSRPDGFGLGLYSCQMIASDHNAKIVTEARPEGGTAFRVVFGTPSNE